MSKTLIATTAIAAGLTFAAAAAQASYAVASTPMNNAVFGQLEGWTGGPVYAAGNYWVDIWYLGSDSTATNSFAYAGITYQTVSDDHTGKSSLFGGSFAPVKIGGVSVPKGDLDFSFSTDADGGGTVSNSSNPKTGAPNFFSSFTNCNPDLTGCAFDTIIDGSTPQAGMYTLLLGFNDGSEGPLAPPRYDDLVILLQISSSPAVPEPASLGLAGLALAALGLSARRRRRAR